jgi:hypothetical protein
MTIPAATVETWTCDAEATDVQLGGDVTLGTTVEVVAAGNTGHQQELRWPGPHVDRVPS